MHDGHVSGTLGYVTGKCGRCDKILCNRCPIKHEGKTGSDIISLEHIDNTTLECGNIRLNIGPRVIMMKWNSQMRGNMDYQNPEGQLT